MALCNRPVVNNVYRKISSKDCSMLPVVKMYPVAIGNSSSNSELRTCIVPVENLAFLLCSDIF